MFSEEQETIFSDMMKNGKDISEEEWKKAESLLGDTLSLSPAWRSIER
jgi:hypothetical protein